MKSNYDISIVLPAYNEAGNLEAVVQDCLNEGARLLGSFEVIIVDDGSLDGTGDLADRFAENDPRIQILHHEENRGYGAALRSGFERACMEYIFFTDSDGQFKISEMEKLLACLPECPAVIGFRSQRKDPWHRRIYGVVFSALIRLLFGVKERDVNCAFKVFRKSLIEGLDLKSPGALINAELLVHFKSLGIDPVEIPVTHRPRLYGKQTGGSVKVILRAMAELIKLKFECM